YLTQQSKEAPHEILYWHTAKGKRPEGVVREGPFKLLIKTKNKPELYHLENDLSESSNIAPSNPDRVQRMLALWKEWDKNNKPDLWGKPKKPYQFADYEWLKGTQHYRAASE
ncbi:hypothetical protein N8533_02910, partial [Akkermansiaceae bacterium]|nr:hypothetical protein [Akkermansiaceae bacterium]